MKRLVSAAIGLYQRTLSPDHSWVARLFPGGYCRFQPSCSMYTKAAVERRGVLRGLTLGGWRILRCNPWNPGGWDPVPESR